MLKIEAEINLRLDNVIIAEVMGSKLAAPRCRRMAQKWQMNDRLEYNTNLWRCSFPYLFASLSRALRVVYDHGCYACGRRCKYVFVCVPVRLYVRLPVRLYVRLPVGRR